MVEQLPVKQKVTGSMPVGTAICSRISMDRIGGYDPSDAFSNNVESTSCTTVVNWTQFCG